MAKKEGKKIIVQDDDFDLNVEQEKFCHEFIKDLNATQAYLRSYNTTNENTAKANGSKLLTKTNIQRKITELNKQKLQASKVDAQVILKELLALATSDITEVLDDDGVVRPKREWPSHFKKSISQIQIDEIYLNNQKIGYAKKIKMWDKPKALELLGRHLKLFTDVLEHKVTELSDDEIERQIKELESK